MEIKLNEGIYSDNYAIINYVLGIQNYNKEETQKTIQEGISDFGGVEDYINSILENINIYYSDIYNLNQLVNLNGNYSEEADEVLNYQKWDNFDELLQAINTSITSTILYNLIISEEEE